MDPKREYLSEMDVFKVISESKYLKYESKIYPEKGMSPKNKDISSNFKSNNEKVIHPPK